MLTCGQRDESQVHDIVLKRIEVVAVVVVIVEEY